MLTCITSLFVTCLAGRKKSLLLRQGGWLLGAILFIILSIVNLQSQTVVIIAIYPRTNENPAHILVAAEQLASNICNIQQATDMTHIDWFTGASYSCYFEYQWVIGGFNIDFYSEMFFRSENIPCDWMPPLLAETTYPLDAEERKVRWNFGGRLWGLNNRLESTYSTVFPFEEHKRYTGVEVNL